MNELFLKIINMSISASWLVLAVLILRLVLKKAPKWVNVLLWGIVAIKLICPFAIESSISMIPDSVGSGELVSEWMDDYIDDIEIHHPDSVYYDAAIGAGREPISDGEGGYYVVTKHDQLGEPATIENTVMPILSAVWVLGMTVLALYTAISYFRLRRKLDTAVRYKDNIFQSENVNSPFVLGIIKPRIYLPFNMNGQDLEHVVAHEQAHIRRKDHWWKPLGFLLLTIHWFNPLMWLAYVLLCRDIELACDEKVIKELGNEQRADYTQALVACSVNRRMIAACPIAFGEIGVKERVKSVMNYKKPAFWIIILAVIACVVVAICFLTNPKQDSYTLRIVVPAGSQEEFVYSDEEVSTIKNSIKIWAGDGLGNTEVLLSPVNETKETGYTATYLTHGMPVEFDAEKDMWFKVGVNMQNPTDEDIIVYVEVENVEVRIAESEFVEENSIESLGDASEWITEEINVEKRDITHDGVVDYIVTSMTYDSTYIDTSVALADKIEQQIMYDIVCVKVYKGSNTSDTYSEEQLLWSQEYSRVHVGNGQLSVVRMDDKDYILTSNLWAGQGLAAWEFEVFSLNEKGEKNVVDNQSVEFKLDEDDFADEECYAEYNHSIEKYIADGILIVACDIDLEQQFIRTQESQYIPQNYYSTALVKYDKAEDDHNEEKEGSSNLTLNDESVTETEMWDFTDVAYIRIINGNNGERVTIMKGTTIPDFQKIVDLCQNLEKTTDTEKNSRVGYNYSIVMYGENEEKVIKITPYKDGYTADDTFYKYSDADNNQYDNASVRLLDYLGSLFYPDEEVSEIVDNPLTTTTEFSEEVNTLANVEIQLVEFNSTEGKLEITNHSGKELTTGEKIDIQIKLDGKWYRIDQIYDALWKDIAYNLPTGQTRTLSVQWSFMYGELPAGSYRIVKEVIDYHAPGDYDTYYLAAEFEIN